VKCEPTVQAHADARKRAKTLLGCLDTKLSYRDNSHNFGGFKSFYETANSSAARFLQP
jgi:hypothetical protein